VISRASQSLRRSLWVWSTYSRLHNAVDRYATEYDRRQLDDDSSQDLAPRWPWVPTPAFRGFKTMARFFQGREDVYRRLLDHAPLQDHLPKTVNPRCVALAVENFGRGGSTWSAVSRALGLKATGRWDPVFVVRDGDRDLHEPYIELLRDHGISAVFLPSDQSASERETWSRGLAPETRAGLERLWRLTERVSAEFRGSIYRFYGVLHGLGPVALTTDDLYVGATAGTAAQLLGIERMIVVGAGLTPVFYPTVPYSPSLRAIVTLLIDRPGVTLQVGSRTSAAEFRAWLERPAQPISIVHPNADPTKIRPLVDGEREAFRTGQDIPDDATVVGGVFGISPIKHPMLWIEVARRVVAQRANVFFVAIGQGTLLDAAREKVATLGLSDRIRFPGWVEDVRPAYANFDIVLHTSQSEGLGNVFTESQSLGIPAVATGQGGVREAFIDGRSGLFVPGGDPGDMAAAALRLIDDAALRARMGAAARDYALTNFDKVTQVAKVERDLSPSPAS